LINNDDNVTQLYCVKKLLGVGKNSQVYKAVATNSAQVVCLKIEPIDNDSQLQNELTVLQILKGCKGVPAVLFSGTTTFLNMKWRACVTDIVGDHTLADLRYKLNISELCDIAHTAINIFKNIHNRGILHNDIKP